ncbi:MAG: hypothetical protein Q4G24_01345 [Paracoccus sp. (in: a-proteobacteria)]|uniref:hypothetical protein n=1 Tax=Paracoccus sp. TaxID=267 RepID=UPI0026DF229A|nr:hypothetical protein [Paracoccus sp. (in: a-proteobacteria)]MDO5620095.1 hypothetical protein [Paracoccus sp. (in: a-proteobacteria)]
MTLHTQMTAFASALRARLPEIARPSAGVYSLGLIDEMTGKCHRIVRSTNPDRIMTEMMRNRDPRRWRAVILRNPAAEVIQ